MVAAMPSPTSTLEPPLELVSRFAADGAVHLPGAFRDWVGTLARGVEQIMARPSKLERSYRPKDGSAPFFQDLCRWADIPEFRRFAFESGIGALAARLMGSASARLFHDHVLVKEPGSGIVTPWHQDTPYYCVTAERSVSFWIPLDPVARDVSPEFVAGTQLGNRMFRPKRFDGSDLYTGDASEEAPDIDADRDRYRILGWEMEPGDAVAFHFSTIHGAPANANAGRRRRAVSWRIVGDGARFVDRGGKGSPPLAHLTLRTGDPLDGPDFPLLHPR
jgi:ectoine hydroxylase-related dioxygenase (phytanoyl-CoA dioxygenase family)